MLTIDVLYNPETRRLTLPPGSDLYGGATIDSASVSIRITGLNTAGTSEDLSVRLDFQLPLLTEAHEYVNPFLEMEKTGTSEAGEVWECVLPTDILAATAVHNKLPFQLVIRYGDVVINSRNIISLKTTTAIDALGEIEEFYRPYVMFRNDTWAWEENFTYKKGAVVTYNGNFYISKTGDNLGHDPEETVGEYWILPVAIPDSTIVGVEYDDENAELTFTRQDGSTISISLPDLKYDLFRVATEADLPNIQDALNGDMAVTDAGVWYVYYNDGVNPTVWNQMSSPTTLNGSQTTTPAFYAPLGGGNDGNAQYLVSGGTGSAPIWESKVTTLDNSSALPTSGAVKTAIDAVAENLQVETSNRALVSDADNKIIASEISTTELNTLDGVDTSTTIQAQLTNLNNAITAEARTRASEDATLDGRLDTLESYIPDGTSSSNKLTNTRYVDDADIALRTAISNEAKTRGEVDGALDARLDAIEAHIPDPIDLAPASGSTLFVSSGAIYAALDKKQSSMVARNGVKITPGGESIEGKPVDVVEHTNAVTAVSEFVGAADKTLKIKYDAQGHFTGHEVIGVQIAQSQVDNLVAKLGSIDSSIADLQGGKVDKLSSSPAGTGFVKVNVNEQGQVIGHGSLAESDIPSLSISKVTGLQNALESKLDDTQLVNTFEGHITGDNYIPSAKLTQTSLDAKMDDSQLVDEWSETPSRLKVPSERLVKSYVDEVADNLNVQTANMVLISDANNKIVSSSVITVDELNTLDGITTSDGSTIQAQLDGKVNANAAIAGGTKCKISFDAKGLVTGGADLAESDIPTLSISKVSGLQTALNNKLDDTQLITQWNASASDTSIPSEALVKGSLDAIQDILTVSTADKVIVSDSNKKLISSTVSTAELGTLSGISTASTIQAQLNAKLDDSQLVTAWQTTPDNTHIPSEKLVKDSLDNITSSITLSPNMAVITNDNGKLAVSSATATELGFVHGVTSGIQAQLNSKAPTSHASNSTTYGVGSATAYGHVKVVQTLPTSKPDGTPDPEADYTVSAAGIRAFVNSSISTGTAMFLGTYDAVDDLHLTTSATNAQIATALSSFSEVSTATNGDYVFITVDTIPSTPAKDEYRRFKFNGSGWEFEYTLNNSSFTDTQWAAINSGISAPVNGKYEISISGNADTATNATNAATASKLSNTTAIGSSSQPVYFTNGGVPYPVSSISTSLIAVAVATGSTGATNGLMSADDKKKLNGIAAGAEVNVQADWTEANTSSDAYIKHKPTTIAEAGITDAKITTANNISTITLGAATMVPFTGVTNGTEVSGEYISALSKSGNNLVVSRTTLPTLTGGAAETDGQYVSGVTVSGHEVTVTKANLPALSGGGTASSGKYISGVTVNGHKISIAQTNLPTLSGGGTATSGKYISAVTVNGHAISISETSLPSLSKGNDSGSGNAVTNISVSGHQITLVKGKTFLESHQAVVDKDVTQAWGTRAVIAKIGNTEIHLTALSDQFTHNPVTLNERVYS